MKKFSTVFLVLAILAVSLSCNLITGAGTGPTKQPAAPLTKELPTPPALPAAPQALSSSGTPEEQAAMLVDAIRKAPDNPARLTAWLGVYAAFGIPVLDETGISLTGTGDDPLGAPYWSIWYASGMDFPRRGMTLVDAGKILTIRKDITYDPNGGNILLADLQQAVKSSDPQTRLLGLFMQARIASASAGKDLAQSSAPEELIIDPASVNLLNWLLIRSDMLGLAKTEKPASYQGPALVSQALIAPLAALSAGKPRCAEMFGSEDTTAAMNYVIGKFYGGISIPGTTLMPGMTETFLKQVGVSAAKVDKISSFMGRANAIAQLLNLYMQIHALSVEAQVSPMEGLIRTKTTSDGKRATITFHLFSDKDKVPDGNELWACMTSFISSAMGVSVSIPPSEPISGADIIFKPGKNIPEKVLIDSENTNYRITTDSSGNADLKLIGRAQKKTLPDSAPEMNDTYTLWISAQPEGITAGSIAGMFWDSLSFWVVPTAASAVAPVVDLLKTMTFDLGDMEFGLTDWGGTGYKITGTVDHLVVNDQICGDLLSPFQFKGDMDGVVTTFDFIPAGALYNGQFSVTAAGAGFNVAGNGPYQVVLNPDGTGLLKMDRSGCVNISVCKSALDVFQLTPLDPSVSCQ